MTTLLFIIGFFLGWILIGLTLALIASRFNKNVDGFECVLYWPAILIIAIIEGLILALFFIMDLLHIPHPTLDDIMN